MILKEIGRAEVAVYAINRQVRATLLQADADEVLRCARIGKEVPEFPAFLQKVTVRKRNWEKGSMAPTCEVVKYLFSAWDHHGHWMMKADGMKLVTRYVLRQVKDAPTTQEWIAIEEELVNALVKRRRMREKTAPMVRGLEGGDEEKKNEEKDQAGRVAKIIEEEMGMLIEEDPSIIPQVMEVIGKLRRLIEGSMDDGILQTRIVSPLEVLRDWKAWVGPAYDEVNSLLLEKKAFNEISSEELQELKAPELPTLLELLFPQFLPSELLSPQLLSPQLLSPQPLLLVSRSPPWMDVFFPILLYLQDLQDLMDPPQTSLPSPPHHLLLMLADLL